MQEHRRATFVAWLPLAAAVTGIVLIIYGAVQQEYRQGLNDPQIQIAEDTARVLAAGVSAAELIPAGGKVDIGASLAPWVAIYDTTGAPRATTGLLENAVPQVPFAVLRAAGTPEAKAAGNTQENRITWEPLPGVRQAIVVVRAGDAGYVVAGRNMREVETRIGHMGAFLVGAWFVIMIATLALAAAREPLVRLMRTFL